MLSQNDQLFIAIWLCFWSLTLGSRLQHLFYFFKSAFLVYNDVNIFLSKRLWQQLSPNDIFDLWIWLLTLKLRWPFDLEVKFYFLNNRIMVIIWCNCLQNQSSRSDFIGKKFIWPMILTFDLILAKSQNVYFYVFFLQFLHGAIFSKNRSRRSEFNPS